MTTQLVDIGANLGHESFQHDLANVLARAQAHGVTQLVVTGASAHGSRDALALARAHPGVLYATAGVHPHHASDFDADTELLRELHAQSEVKAWSAKPGSTITAISRRAQRDCSRSSVNCNWRSTAANRCSCTSAMRMRIFWSAWTTYAAGLVRAVVHCFTGEKNELFDYLDRDFHIGITGWICDERRSCQHLRELVKHIPAERLLLETDAPYLLPRTVKPAPSHRRNEPMYLAHICAEVARDRGEDVTVTAANATRRGATVFRFDDSLKLLTDLQPCLPSPVPAS